MTVDSLAKRLQELLEKKSLPVSRLSRSARKTLAELFDTGILAEELSGRGRRVVVDSRVGLENWISSRYPHGLTGSKELAGRAGGVGNLRDSKRGGGVGASLIHLRGFGSATLQSDEGSFAVAELTERFGAASLLIDEDCQWQIGGRICMVENLETFLQVERIIDDVDIAIYTHGRLSQLVIDWLARCSLESAVVIHFGDYDPVGLSEYLRLNAELGEDVELFMPRDLEEKIYRYGNRDLLRDSRTSLNKLRRSKNAQVQGVIALLDKYSRGLEQEALLIDFASDV